MKITFTILLAGLCACFSLRANAQPRVLTLDNKPGAVAMFTTLQAAYDAARDGDTIMVAGSPTYYNYGSTFVVSKKIHFVGPGYLISENGIPGLVRHGAQFHGISIRKNDQVDGSGTTFFGVSIEHVSNTGTLWKQVWAAFDCCRIGQLGGTAIVNRSLIGSGGSTEGGTIIRNTVIKDHFSFFGPNITLSNCVIGGRVQTPESDNGTGFTASISNSIFVSSTYTSTSFAADFKGSVSHCIAVGNSTLASGRRSFLPEGGGNLNGFNLTDVFVSSGTEDGKWKLKEGSPAIGTGYAGTDIGIFGGGNPYILSGVPPRPRITRLVVPAATTQETGLRFEVDAKAH